MLLQLTFILLIPASWGSASGAFAGCSSAVTSPLPSGWHTGSCTEGKVSLWHLFQPLVSHHSPFLAVSYTQIVWVGDPGVVMCWHMFYRPHSMAGVGREPDSTGSYPGKFWISPDETPQPLWPICSSTLSPAKTFSLIFTQNFLYCTLCLLPLFMLVGTTEKILAQSSSRRIPALQGVCFLFLPICMGKKLISIRILDFELWAGRCTCNPQRSLYGIWVLFF